MRRGTAGGGGRAGSGSVRRDLGDLRLDLRRVRHGDVPAAGPAPEPAPPPGFLERAHEYAEAATIPRLLLLRTEKIGATA